MEASDSTFDEERKRILSPENQFENAVRMLLSLFVIGKLRWQLLIWFLLKEEEETKKDGSSLPGKQWRQHITNDI